MQQDDTEDPRIVLGLLESVERDGNQSQRRLAAEFGIALGLVNAYLKRCVRKGLVKVKTAPARRYTYYLTPQGFSEKSRLTVQFLTDSFSFFRRARADCAEAFDIAKARGWSRIVLAGLSDLAEISTICAAERGIPIVGVVDDKAAPTQFIGLPVTQSYAAVAGGFDGVLVTELKSAQAVFDAAVAKLGPDRVLAPKLLGVSTQPAAEAEP